MRDKGYHLTRFFTYIVILFVIILLAEEPSSLGLMGTLLLIVSVDSMVMYKDKGNIFMMLALLTVTNICLVYGCFWFYEENAYTWQITLTGSKSAILAAKSLFVFYISILISLILNYRPTDEAVHTFNDAINQTRWSLGRAVFWIIYIFLYYILIFCFNRTVNEYVSGNSALYEYAVVIFIALWIYLPHSRIYKVLMLIYASLYILQGLIFGDRSSALPLILALYFLLSKNITPLRFISLAALGIFGANLIGIYRKTFSFNSGIFVEVINRLLYVDSISYSFYSGVQIINASNIINNKLEHFGGWLQSIFLGNSGTYDLARLVLLKGGFHNTGGGMSSTYFYFWGGLPGVICGGLIVGWILGKVFSSNKSFYPFLQIVILVFTLRWYSYFPNVFFRTCIVVPILLYTVLKLLKHTKYKRTSL